MANTSVQPDMGGEKRGNSGVSQDDGERTEFSDIPSDPAFLRAKLASFDDDTISNGLEHSNDTQELFNPTPVSPESIRGATIRMMALESNDGKVRIIQMISPDDVAAEDGSATPLMVGEDDSGGPNTRGVQDAQLLTPDPKAEEEVWLPPFSDSDDFGDRLNQVRVTSPCDVEMAEKPGQTGASNTDKAESPAFLSSVAGKRLHEAAVKVHAVVRFTRMQKLRKRARWATKKAIVFILSHVGLTSLVGLYAVAGGFIFQYLEHGAGEQLRENFKAIRLRNVEQLWNMTMSMNVLFPRDWKDDANKQLLIFEKQIFKAIVEQGWNGTSDYIHGHTREWTYASALLFAITIITTIGYGDIVPHTPGSKVVCMVYAVFGIPLTLLCLANIGKFLATIYRFTWKHAKHLVLIIVRSPKSRNAMCETSEVRVPVIVSMSTMIIYILVGAFIFSRWENWSFLDGSYFCFITLSTIGFGDFVPGQDTETLDSNAKRVVCALYLLFGLALLATIFQLIQDSVKVVVRRYATFLGLSKAQIEKDMEDTDEDEELKDGAKENKMALSRASAASDPEGNTGLKGGLVYPESVSGSNLSEDGNPSAATHLRFVEVAKGMGKLQRAQTFPVRTSDYKKHPESVSRLLSVPEEELSGQSSTVSLDGSRDSLLGAQQNTDPVSVRNLLCKKYTIPADPEGQNNSNT